MQHPLAAQQVLESLQQVQQLVFVLVSMFILVSFLVFYLPLMKAAMAPSALGFTLQ